MASTVFISHAGADAARAAEVSQRLSDAGIETRFDRNELCLGDSFLAFMNDSLTTSDYCLLLWSSHAAATPFVQAEWEAALYRSVREKRSFLVVARLEDLDVPALLAPRLRIDLFPMLEPGLANLVNTWKRDRAVERQSGKPVGAITGQACPDPGEGTPVYIDSEEFQIAAYMKVNLAEPPGPLLDRIVKSFELPREISQAGKIGIKFSYQLMDGELALARGKTLAHQGITEGHILTLQMTMTPFSSSQPVGGQLSPTVFRSGSDLNLEEASKEYRRILTRSGLRDN